MNRQAAFDMDAEEFRRLGHSVVDWMADYVAGIRDRRVTEGESPRQVRAALGDAPLADEGMEAGAVLARAWKLLSEHSLHNGHPRFAGYVISSPAPVGALADLIASTLNANCGAWLLSPMAAEMELQAIGWIAEFIGYPAGCGGLLVSGGNMANFAGVVAARRAMANWDVRSEGMRDGRLRIYASREIHTWLQKAADLLGFGTASIRWVEDVGELKPRIRQDREAGDQPFLIAASAGTVSRGAVDPLRELAVIARGEGLWLHVDGAYGAPAAGLEDAHPDLKALAEADSLALDPHKWFYTPVEAGCVLVRDRKHLPAAFDYSPLYYRFTADEEEQPVNFYTMGPQNSRGFRALKVWVAMQTAGRDGLRRMIAGDIALAAALYEEIGRHPELEALTLGLSVVTFRYLPKEGADVDEVNRDLLDRLQKGGEVFLSNAIVDGRFALRACFVNFRTTMDDVGAIVETVVRYGREAASRQPYVRMKG
ncbi:MAG: pyridoxal-dependent decarboxylase [Bryobacteraceae bacterium]|nr:pyridoxal-dependent decarboxylase [Bryobacteraceae bacterium]